MKYRRKHDEELAAELTPGRSSGDDGINVAGGDGDGLDSNGNATITGGSIVVDGPTDRRTDGQRQRRARRERHLHHLRWNPAGGGRFRDGGGAGDLVNLGLGRREVQLGGAGRHDSAHRRGGRNRIASFTATKTFSSVVYSSAGITSGATYSVYPGESVSGGTLVGTFTADTAPTGGMMGGGGMGGGTPPAGGRPGG